MLCEACQTHPASVHLTDVSNNQKREVHLCDECAQAQGVTIKSYLHKTAPQEPSEAIVGEVEVSSLVADDAESGTGEAGSVESRSCPSCGTSYRQFRSSGKFGCPRDYEVFESKLDDLLEKIHGKNRHIGKIPKRATDEIAREEQLQSLRDDLDQAIRNEAYEEAAELRDRILRVEQRADG